MAASSKNSGNLDSKAAKDFENRLNHAKQIWGRARSNAFAHRYAAEDYRKKASWLFTLQLILGMLGVLGVLGVYIISSNVALQKIFGAFSSEYFTVASVVLSVASLMCGIIQNYRGYEKLEKIHDHNQHSFLYIAQRSREVRYPEIKPAKALSILEDLERDFQTLKATGKEPMDHHFTQGDEILSKIQADIDARNRQSFFSNIDGVNDTNQANEDKKKWINSTSLLHVTSIIVGIFLLIATAVLITLRMSNII